MGNPSRRSCRISPGCRCGAVRVVYAERAIRYPCHFSDACQLSRSKHTICRRVGHEQIHHVVVHQEFSDASWAGWRNTQPSTNHHWYRSPRTPQVVGRVLGVVNISMRYGAGLLNDIIKLDHVDCGSWRRRNEFRYFTRGSSIAVLLLMPPKLPWE